MMQRVPVDFVEKSRPGPWLWFLPAITGAVAIGLAVQTLLAQKELERLRAEVKRQQQTEMAPAYVAMQPAPSYETSARDMLAERSLPWSEVLAALEKVAIPGVLVTSIEAPGVTSNITVQTLMSDYKTVLDYLSTLNGDSPQAGDVQFALQHARVEAAGQQVAASFVVTWGGRSKGY